MEKIEGKNYTLYLGNSLDVLDKLPDNSVDSIVTDPPYEIGFMGKGWDNTGIAFNVEIWKKALRVLKHGGHLLAFNHSRMFHRMMVAIEDAGFEIRDTIMWLYGSGFPKSMNIGFAVDKTNGIESEVIGKSNKGVSGTSNTMIGGAFENGGRTFDIKQAQNEWSGWGTALKPAYEPIVLARKPIAEANIAQNVLKYGVGGINIDECRVGFEDTPNPATNPKYRQENNYKTPVGGQKSNGIVAFTSGKNGINHTGRFPANVIHDGSKEVVDEFPNEDYEVGGSPSRFFYTAKASNDDRNEGLDIAGFEMKRESDRVKDDGVGGDNPRNRTNKPRLNTHPTVKPTDLMKYLVRLITPKGGTILDLFMGSGSTGKAVMLENASRQANYKFIGIDLSEEYVKIAQARIEYAIATGESNCEIVNIDGKKQLIKNVSLFGEE